jgi:dihydroorotase
LAIDEGKIVKIAKFSNLPSASTKVDLKGLITLPGLIDSHVHLRDQNLVYKESFFTGTASAANGGVTSVIDMPNNEPVTSDVTTLKNRMKKAEDNILVNVAFNSAFPSNFDEISQIVRVGAVGFKLYMSNNVGSIDYERDDVLVAAFLEAKKNNVPVAVHAEDKKVIDQQKKDIDNVEMDVVRAYVKSHPPEAEDKAIQRIIKLTQRTDVSVHFCHLSSALGLKSVMSAKKMGLPVTCEVTPHNLLLSSDQYQNKGTLAITDPPLRSQEDVNALWSGLKNGFIDIIASDHAPHTIAEKTANSIQKLKPGIPGLETSLPLLLNQINKGHLSLGEFVRLTAENPARIFSLIKRGFISEGNWADLVVVDMKRKHKIDSSAFLSKAHYSPFDGLQVKGKPVKTFVNGNLVMDDGEIVAHVGSGCIIGSSCSTI